MQRSKHRSTEQTTPESLGAQASQQPAPKQIVLSVRAAEKVLAIFAAQGVDAKHAYLRVGAKPGGCSGYRYELDHATAESLSEADEHFRSEGVRVVVNRECLHQILGSVRIDYQEGNMVERGFRFQPLQGDACGCGESFTPLS